MPKNFRNFGLAILTSIVLAPYLYSKAEAVFSNMQGTVNCQPREIIQVHTTKEVQAVVRRAIREGLSVKAAKSGWQGSNDSSCVSPGGLQIDTSYLNNIIELDSSKQELKVQPGIKLWDLNQKTHKAWQLILPVVQEYAEVTIGGMLGNGTHGSSLGESSSSIQDSIVAATLVDASGEIQDIRGQDLDFVATHLGVLGILTEVTLKMQPSFKVKAALSGHDDKELSSKILDMARAHYAASITWFPGQHKFSVTAYDKVANETPGQAHNGQVETSWWERAFFPLVFKAANIGSSRDTACFLEKQRYEMKTKSFYTEQFAKPVDSPVGWAHEMIYFVCRDKCPFKELPFELEEIAIAQDDLPGFIIEAQELMAKTGACLPLNGIYFRFGHASRGALGMASDRETVYIGMEYVRNPWGNRYPRDFDVIQELEQILLQKYAGRPHWGKNRPAMFTDVREKYPRWQEFEAYRQRMDPNGVFINDFYKRVRDDSGLGSKVSSCVVESSCYCSQDEHCPANYHCESGLVFPTARVCRPISL